MAGSRTVTSTLFRPDNTPWAGGIVKFTPVDDVYVLSPPAHYPSQTIPAITDSSGNMLVTLASGTNATFLVELPSGETFHIVVPDGAATTLEALRAAYAGSPAVVDSFETALAALLPVYTGDITAEHITINGNFQSDTVITGQAVTTSITTTGVMRTSGATSGLGYNTGAGGSSTQNTNKATGVTINRMTGAITMNGAALAANTVVNFTLTNSGIGANDAVIVWIKSGGTLNAYHVWVASVSAGSCSIAVLNRTAGPLSEQPVIGFMVLKGVIT